MSRIESLRKEYETTARRLLELGQQLGGTPQAVANDIILLSAPPPPIVILNHSK